MNERGGRRKRKQEEEGENGSMNKKWEEGVLRRNEDSERRIARFEGERENETQRERHPYLAFLELIVVLFF